MVGKNQHFEGNLRIVINVVFMGTRIPYTGHGTGEEFHIALLFVYFRWRV